MLPFFFQSQDPLPLIKIFLYPSREKKKIEEEQASISPVCFYPLGVFSLIEC
jgi:hypothetical protein